MAPLGPEVSVVIPVRDGAGSLPALLDSLDVQTLARDRFEVIVVDNASRDHTAQIARGVGARVVSEPIPSRSRARNRGVAAARADFIAFTDGDCVAASGWLEALIACRGTAPLVAGPVYVTTGEPPNVVERFEALWRFGQEHWVRQGWAATANLAAERRALEALGGFDVGYRHIGEDADLCLRAGRVGLSLGWCADAAVSHSAEAKSWKMLKRCFFHGYSVNQAHYRLGVGYRAWVHPLAMVNGEKAMSLIGKRQDQFEGREWRRMRRVAQGAYAMRMLGSAWAEFQRAR